MQTSTPNINIQDIFAQYIDVIAKMDYQIKADNSGKLNIHSERYCNIFNLDKAIFNSVDSL